MSRKPLNEFEREQKKLFEQELKKYSIDCLKQIHKIATTSIDMSTRLKANIWILEKLFGKNYQCYQNDDNNSCDNTINVILTTRNGNLVDPEQIENEINEIENEDNNIINDALNNEWDLEYDSDADWGREIYNG